MALLAQDEKPKPPSLRNIIILFAGLLLTVLIIGSVWAAIAQKTHTPFVKATVDERDFAFSVDFYKEASVQTSRDKNYLVATHDDGKQTAIWVAKLESPLSCGRSPGFDYNAQEGMQIHASCYEKDRLTFASNVYVDKQVYQINMTSEKPIDPREAEVIFGSVVIEP